jgi:hypothetical protein
MEAAFGCDFRQVRIHTGHQAARAARALDARAFTLGHDIVFGADQFAPATPAGKRLLAHELAHVVQQSRGGRDGAPAQQVGSEYDPLEDEADRAAQQIVDGGRRPGLRPDSAGLIRRAIRLDRNSARIRIPSTTQPMGPGVHPPEAPSRLDPTQAGFSCGTLDGTGNVLVPAISADGEVTVHGEAGDTLAGWSFGFIQLERVETNWAYYRGQLNSAGSLFLQRGRAPARTARACVDTSGIPALSVFYDPSSTVGPMPAGPVAFPLRVQVNGWNDTPGDSYQLRELNSRTNQVNFLREAQLEFLFCTIFAAQDPAGTLHHLAHFYWNVLWQAVFLPHFTDLTRPWHVTLVDAANARNRSQIFQGAPSDRRFMDLLLAPPIDNCNDVAAAASAFVDPVSDPGAPGLPPAIPPNVCRRESPVWDDFDVRR